MTISYHYRQIDMDALSIISGILPPLLVAGIVAGVGLWANMKVFRVEIGQLRNLMTSGLQKIHEDIQSLKSTTSTQDERIRLLEISQARREGKESVNLFHSPGAA